MLFLEVTLLRVPAWSSCLGQTGDLIWTTLCTKMYLLYWRCCFRGCGSAEVCPRPGNICEAVWRSLTTMFVYGYQFGDMHITATIPYVRDIIYSKHNKCVKECLACFNVRKVCETRQRIHIFSSGISNTINVRLPLKLIINNDKKVAMLWNLFLSPVTAAKE